MIEELFLKDFGKFKNTRFKFGTITLFEGENEAGKTTLFDALLDTLTSPKGNTEAARNLRRRYGENRKAELVCNGERAELEAEEFLGVFAIHSGTQSLDFSSGKSWLKKLKNALFSGGADPAYFSRFFSSLSTTDRRREHMKLYDQKREELEQTEAEYGEIKSFLEKIKISEKSISEKKEQLSLLEEETGVLRNELKSVQFDLDQQKKIQSRAEILGSLAFLKRGEDLKKGFERYAGYAEDEYHELKELEKSLRAAADALHISEGGIRTLEAELGRIREGLKDLEWAQQEKKRLFEEAGKLIREMKSGDWSIPFKKTVRWNPVLLLLSSLPAAGSIISLFIFNFPWPVLALSGAGLGLAVLLVLLARKIKYQEDREAVVKRLEDVKSRWRLLTGEELKSSSFVDIIRELGRYENEYTSSLSRIHEIKEQLLNREKQMSGHQKAGRELNDELASLRRRASRLMEKTGCAGADEYAAGLAEKKRTEEQMGKWNEELKDLLEHHKMEEFVLETHLLSQIKILGQEIERPALTGAELNALENRHNKMNIQLNQLNEEKLRLSNEIHEKTGEIKNPRKNYPERMMHLEKNVLRLRSELEDMDISRRAAGLAAEIFEAMSGETDTLLKELGGHIAVNYSELTENARKIRLNSLENDGLSLEDAAGKMRSVQDVSRGTADSFYFACRLTMAEKLGEKIRLLVLDEPFHALDSEREGKAFRVLRAFLERNDWQVILLTKETRWRDLIKEIFPEKEIVIHTLKK